MFKIIETVERGRRELTIVPGRWEQSGTLFWPKHFAYKFQKDPKSTPEPNWISIPCKVKRNLLKSYELAEKELSIMIDAETTTTEEVSFEQMPKSRAKRIKVLMPKTPTTPDLNDLAASCIVAENNNAENYLQPYNVMLSPKIVIPEISDLDYENHVQDEMVPIEVLQIQKSNEQEKKMDTMINTLNTVLDNQHKIIKELASFQVLFDKAMKKKIENLGNTSCDNHRPILAFEPIDNKDSLQELNDRLKNTDTFNDHVKALSIICGVNTKMKAIDHCYMLVDKFFTRNFFTLCSWAGGAKIPNTKFPFKFYENVIALFFKLINLADSRFTLEECEDFFKGVIRNCIRRNTCLNQRTSKSKKRPKKLSYNIKEKGHQDEGNAYTVVEEADNEYENDEQVTTELSDEEVIDENELSSTENTKNS